MFGVVHNNRYLFGDSTENVLSITIFDTEPVAKYVIVLVTMPFFSILSRFTEFSEFGEMHLEKTVLY